VPESLIEVEADLILHLSEDVLSCVSDGEFTEEAIEDVFVAMMETYEISPEELEEVIEEFVDEDVGPDAIVEVVEEDILDERKVLKKSKRKIPGADDPELDEPVEPKPKPKKKIKVKRKLRGDEPEPEPEPDPKLKAAEKEPGEDPKKEPEDKKEGGLMQMLKHALIGAVKKMYKQPDKAGEIVKRGLKRAGKKAVKHLARKGMKMVFGKWIKTGKGGAKKPEPPKKPVTPQQKAKKEEPGADKKEESVGLAEEVRGILDEGRRSASVQAKKDFVRQAQERQGVVRMPRINKDEYPTIKGLEGPFQFRGGRILYYDPRKGRYYDRKTDMYLSRGENLGR